MRYLRFGFAFLITCFVAVFLFGCGPPKEPSKAGPIVLKMDPIVANLADPGRYVKIVPTLQFSDQESKARAEAEKSRLRDIMIFMLRGKTAGDVQNTAELKKEMLAVANRALAPDEATEIFFEDIIVQ